ncbi:uncharacterized protein [Miscanthus floridulus]|uniref:uncharacterized protein n=1 Tax=Miscanthus floridulus TaxID=154761 RepID=UPI00345A50E8
MGTILAMDSHMMCEVYGNIGHSGNDCLETRKEAAFINNGFRQPGNNGWNNQPRPQETQLTQIATAFPIDSNGKIPAQLENSCENVKMVTTRGGMTTHDQPNPNQSTGKAKERQEAEPSTKEKEQEEETTPKDFIDTNYLPFPTMNSKQAMDGQLTPFVEMIEKIHYFDQALCNLGASVSVMPKAIFNKLNLTQLMPTPMMLQLADSMVRYSVGIVEDILMKIQDCYIPIDFMVLDMEVAKESTLILG